jgi:hypothetical protein
VKRWLWWLFFHFRANLRIPPYAKWNLHQPPKSSSNAKINDLNLNIFGQLMRQKSKIRKTFKKYCIWARFWVDSGIYSVSVRTSYGFRLRPESTSKSSSNIVFYIYLFCMLNNVDLWKKNNQKFKKMTLMAVFSILC